MKHKTELLRQVQLSNFPQKTTQLENIVIKENRSQITEKSEFPIVTLAEENLVAINVLKNPWKMRR